MYNVTSQANYPLHLMAAIGTERNSNWTSVHRIIFACLFARPGWNCLNVLEADGSATSLERKPDCIIYCRPLFRRFKFFIWFSHPLRATMRTKNTQIQREIAILFIPNYVCNSTDKITRIWFSLKKLFQSRTINDGKFVSSESLFQTIQ